MPLSATSPSVSAAGSAVLFSALGTLVVWFVLNWSYGYGPTIVSIVTFAGAYMSLLVTLPVILGANLIGGAISDRVWIVHVVAVVLAIGLWLIFERMLRNYSAGDRDIAVVMAAGPLASVPAHWLAFLRAQRRRRQDVLHQQQ